MTLISLLHMLLASIFTLRECRRCDQSSRISASFVAGNNRLRTKSFTAVELVTLEYLGPPPGRVRITTATVVFVLLIGLCSLSIIHDPKTYGICTRSRDAEAACPSPFNETSEIQHTSSISSLRPLRFVTPSLPYYAQFSVATRI